MGAEDEGQRGYAKLAGKRTLERTAPGSAEMIEEDFEELITALPARLGREGGESSEDGSDGKGCFVSLGTVKSLSRHHATIQWDFSKGVYRIDCLSKLLQVPGPVSGRRLVKPHRFLNPFDLMITSLL